MTSARLHSRRIEQGISLYTLLAAVVVLGVLTSVLVTSFTGTHSKGVAAWALVKNVATASQRFHLDTSCWPGRIDALWDYNVSDNNSCDNTTIPKRMWHGPYMKKGKLKDSNHEMLTPQFGPKATVGVALTPKNEFKVKTHDMTEELLNALLEACHADVDKTICFKHPESIGISYIAGHF